MIILLPVFLFFQLLFGPVYIFFFITQHTYNTRMSLLRPILTTTLRITPRVRTSLIRNTRLTPCLVSQTRQVTSPSTPGSSDSSTTSA